ncbi:hypothetical protein [Nitratireductor luteus]|uniref:hypothetical protein n=1 Tax=Nitratireductor luteus TaxID=2976980 RepID=UPI0022402301|nr:hypothetical protein [Nitratireductor luteus]
MKTLISAAALAAVLVTPALAIEPIPGSITYDGPSQSRLEKTPVGSVYLHEFNSGGNRYQEMYVVGDDGRLELRNRQVKNDG